MGQLLILELIYPAADHHFLIIIVNCSILCSLRNKKTFKLSLNIFVLLAESLHSLICISVARGLGSVASWTLWTLSLQY